MPRALIIGGSIGGIFAATLLSKIGWEVMVFERSSSDLADRGLNIAATDELFGVMRDAGVTADASLAVPWRSRIRLDCAGNTMSEVPLPGLTTLWARIYRPIKTALPVQSYRREMRLEHVAQDASSVTAMFADGSRKTGDLLIGADGMYSTVRRQFLPGLETSYCGYVGWRVAADEQDIPHEMRPTLLEHMTFSFPNREMILTIPMPGPEGHSRPGQRRCQFVWFRSADREHMLPQLCTDIHGRSHRGAVHASLVQPRFVNELKARAKALLPPCIAQQFGHALQVSLHPSFEIASPRIVFGRVVLLGDAAFVARRHVATGVTKAALDAKSLADALATAKGDVKVALAHYTLERHAFGEALVARGRRLGRYVEVQLELRAAGEETSGRWHDIVMSEYGATGIMTEHALAVH